MTISKRTIKEPHYTARTLAKQTGLSLSTIYRRKRKGYSDLDIVRESSVMREHASAGSNWKKVASKKTATETSPKPKIVNQATAIINELSLDTDTKDRKRVVHWEPADDYGTIKRLKVLGGWIVKVEGEVVFVSDPKHVWEV